VPRARNPDLHGNVPDKSAVALLLIDTINDLEFPEGDRLLRHALPMADRIAALKRRARAAGRPVVEKLRPEKDDYFVLKPKHSGFYSTVLDVLLEHLQVHTVILTGMAANICILFTANDAYMRDYHLVVPADCVASNTEAENRNALEQMQKVLKADLTPAERVDLEGLIRA
jgi:nicotinamidase-related amidase